MSNGGEVYYGEVQELEMEAAYVMALGIKSIQPKAAQTGAVLRWMGRGKDPKIAIGNWCVEINRHQVEATFQ